MDITIDLAINNVDLRFDLDITTVFGRETFGAVEFDLDLDLAASGASNYGFAMLPALASFGGDVPDGYGYGAAMLPALVSQGSGGEYIPPELEYGYSILPRLVSFGVSTTVIGGDGSATLPRLISKGGDTEYGEGMAWLKPLRSHGNEGPGALAMDAVSYVYPFDGAIVARDHILVFDSQGLLTDTISLSRILAEEALSSLVASGTCEIIGSFLLSAITDLLASTAAPAAIGHISPTAGAVYGPAVDDSARVWVVNMDTGASSQYDGYGFNSMVYREETGEYLGFADDGIYRLDGDTDNGVPIAAQVEFGMSDYGTFRKKKAQRVHAAVGSDKNVYLKVDVDGVSRVYRLDSYGREIRSRQAQVAFNHHGTHWSFTLLNSDGGDLDLAALELRFAALNWRIR